MPHSRDAASLAQTSRDDVTARDVCRLPSISEQTIYRCKRNYDDMGTSEIKRLRELEGKNARLKRMIAERDLEIDVIKEVLRGE